jgi:hypothetical protein
MFTFICSIFWRIVSSKAHGSSHCHSAQSELQGAVLPSAENETKCIHWVQYSIELKFISKIWNYFRSWISGPGVLVCQNQSVNKSHENVPLQRNKECSMKFCLINLETRIKNMRKCEACSTAKFVSSDLKGTVTWDFHACFLACMDASRPECELFVVF